MIVLRKGFLSLLTVLCVFAFFCSGKAFAAFGKCGDNLTWLLDNNGILTISGTGKMYSYSESEPLIPDGIVVKNIIIQDGVTSIGSYAFYGCKDVVSINIPDSVTTIAGGVFQNCTSLSSIFIPASVKTVYGSKLPFFGCSSTMKIFCETETSPASQWGNTWNSYKEINYNYYNLTTYYGYSRDEYDFFASLTGEEPEIVVPDVVRTICPSAFKGNVNLTKITIPDTVTKIGDSAFSGCTSLKDIYYLGTKESALSITTENGNSYFTFAIWHLFIDPPQANATMTLPKSLNTVQSEAFADNSAKNIIIPASVKTIESHAFANCKELEMLYFEGSPTNIADDILSGCENVLIVVLQGSDAEKWASDMHLNIEYHQ